MARQNETGMDRLKKIKLWQWGLLVIFGGLMGGIVTMVQPPSSGGSSDVEQAKALGRAFGVLLPVLVGIGMIITHFVRNARR